MDSVGSDKKLNSTYKKLNIANSVIRWPATSCRPNLKVKIATQIYLRLNVWTIEQYRAKCSNGTDTAFHRTYSCSFNYIGGSGTGTWCSPPDVNCGGPSPSKKCVYGGNLCNGRDDCGNEWDEKKEMCGQFTYWLIHFNHELTYPLAYRFNLWY